MKRTVFVLLLTLTACGVFAQEAQKVDAQDPLTSKENSLTTEELVALCIEQKTRLAEVAKQKDSWKPWCEKEVEKGWQPISGPEYDRAKKRKYSW